MSSSEDFTYADLFKEGAPKMLVGALADLGTIETPGKGNNPKIMGWAKELGLTNIHKGDDVPWCGLVMAHWANDAGKKLPPNPSRAKSWANFGSPAPIPMLGDVLVFEREGGGHVGLYVGEDAGHFHVLGGNQSDRVCIRRLDRGRMIGARRPLYSSGQPKNVRVIRRADTGVISKNEG